MTHTPPILLLGAAGFIGARLCNALALHGERLRAFDRVIPANAPAGIEWRQGDFLDEAALTAALEGVETVYHLVSTTIPATSNQNPYIDAETNILGTIRLLELAVERGVKRVVFVSSGGTVYGIAKELPIPETHPTFPICAYGISKLAIERYLHLYKHLKGLDYIVLRVANPYGPGQQGQRGQGAIGTFLHQILQGKPLEIWGDGEVIRDYLHVDDVVEALVKAKDYHGNHHIFNISSGVGHTLNDLIHLLEKALGKPVARNYTPSRQVDVPANILDNRLAMQELGWKPGVELEQGIHRMVG